MYVCMYVINAHIYCEAELCFVCWQTYGQMDHYAEVISADGHATEQDYLKIAAYFEKKESHFKAGVFYFKASQYAKASFVVVVVVQ